MTPHTSPRTLLRASTASAALLALALTLPAVPAAADPRTDDPGTSSAPVSGPADPRSGRSAAASSDVADPGVPIGEDEGRRVLLERETRPVAPGIDLTSFDWVASQGFIRGQVLQVELGDGRVRADYLDGGSITDPAPLTDTAGERGAVAAVNGDFFDINNSFAPLGAARSQEGLVKGPTAGHDLTVGFDEGGLGHITRSLLEGVISLPDGTTVPLGGYNQHRVAADGIGAFTELWGEETRGWMTTGAQRVREVTLVDGVVTAVADAAGEGQVPAGTTVLVGRDAGADRLTGLQVGDAVAVTHELRFSGAELETALGGNVQLVDDGEVVQHGDPAAHPRTAVGFDEAGDTAFFVVIDGRVAQSRGMTYTELGGFMTELGAHEALNLDGGGSSTMLARETGEDDLDVENTPSDGTLRPVPNGLGLLAAEGSGRLDGIRVVPAADEEDESLLRVFPGLTRQLAGLGHDETLAPAPVDPRWRSTDVLTARVDRDGTVTGGQRSGPVTIEARDRRVTGEVGLQVLEPLDRIRPSVSTVNLSDRSQTGTFRIVGADRGGFEAPVEPADVRLDHDRSQVSIEPDGAGGWTITPLTDTASVVVTATVQGRTASMGITVGVEERVLADFDSGTAGWTFGSARGSGSLSPGTGEDGSGALTIDYDFTQSTATRTAYATAPTPFQVEGQPLRVGADVLATGQGEWTAFTIRDAEGRSQAIYGPYLTEAGWQRVEVDIPQTLAFPIQVTRFTAIETGADRSYRSSVTIDNLSVAVAPQVQPAPAERVTDDVVVQDGTLGTDGRAYRFAVVSDAQFTAGDQSLVPAARRTLREAVAADPDFVVINGDFVDTGYPADLALARKVIDEELEGKVPWYYVPGNHEIYGTGNIAAFEAEFGPAQHSFVHEGTRFVLLDSSTGTLSGGGFDQWQLLDRALDEARTDDDVTGVVTLWHHPTRDPSPLAASQLTDRYEAQVVEDLLADFRADTGKGAASIGSHVGSFSAASVDGVPYVVNGNMGKAPSTDPADGGFSGWSLVGIDPDALSQDPEDSRWEPEADRDWIRVEMRAHVDELALVAPATLAVGASGQVEATVTQGSRSFPVGYPVSADWSGERVHVGAGRAPRQAVVRLDPATGELTALRAGTATVAVEVNGERRETQVVVTP
ncbi:phosphodiester glycosidase family protein [Auraticoccus monumenti]|uniref:Calcineurin-like phosphoesterase n=1 Tax=Auraticoccus monumenti TaxID=675864 RepID=A0A1G6XT68_9ACTN|nr:phosphodiester glycosidase family protein [Auraticoccus monumenti]SDD81389.1 Calcineurin-like phosphoesterase [Auraticoccus monumenti]